ncbi:hypothetical protein [Micromonospora craniellae]|uniref:hypothetical protein n=1 Tax=Micromonospora craniellae TaxID=2294034 RepID=UPI001CC795BB|nr:hypothetical protein [Micromonospora craniellae]
MPSDLPGRDQGGHGPCGRRRQDEKAVRRALGDHQTHAVGHHGFRPVRLDVPEIELDTSDGYRPRLDEIVAFVNAGR